jgi:hypothetical protein
MARSTLSFPPEDVAREAGEGEDGLGQGCELALDDGEGREGGEGGDEAARD